MLVSAVSFLVALAACHGAEDARTHNEQPEQDAHSPGHPCRSGVARAPVEPALVEARASIVLSTGEAVELRLIHACLDLRTYLRSTASHWTGVPARFEMRAQYRFVEALSFTVDGEAADIPASAFADLISTSGFSIVLKEAEAGVVAHLSGSGGALGGWTARLTFDDIWLVERYVTSTNFPDESFERTEYGAPRFN